MDMYMHMYMYTYAHESLTICGKPLGPRFGMGPSREAMSNYYWHVMRSPNVEPHRRETVVYLKRTLVCYMSHIRAMVVQYSPIVRGPFGNVEWAAGPITHLQVSQNLIHAWALNPSRSSRECSFYRVLDTKHLRQPRLKTHITHCTMAYLSLLGLSRASRYQALTTCRQNAAHKAQ